MIAEALLLATVVFAESDIAVPGVTYEAKLIVVVPPWRMGTTGLAPEGVTVAEASASAFKVRMVPFERVTVILVSPLLLTVKRAPSALGVKLTDPLL